MARNSLGQFVPNANISLHLSLLSGGTTGTVVYSEIRKVTTINVGLFSAGIGSTGATPVIESIKRIDWSTGNIYLKVEADLLGGNGFASLGNTELVSIPYALYAANGKKAIPAPQVSTDRRTLRVTREITISGGNSVTLPSGSGSPGCAAGGDLNGSYPNPSVVRLQGKDVSYAAAVSVDLHTLGRFGLKNSSFAVAATNEGGHFNVWVNPEKGGHEVYYEGTFSFHLQRTSQKIWNVTPGENYDSVAHKEIVEAVTYRLMTTP